MVFIEWMISYIGKTLISLSKFILSIFDQFDKNKFEKSHRLSEHSDPTGVERVNISRCAYMYEPLYNSSNAQRQVSIDRQQKFTDVHKSCINL